MIQSKRAKRINALREMRAEYRAWLQGPEWDAIKSEYVVNHPYRCAACGGGGQLHLHHLKYADPPKNTSFADLMWLCKKPCHVIADHLRRRKLVAPDRESVVKAIRRRLHATIPPKIPHPLDRL